ncbi:MAG TPA: phosphotransferase [Pseudonocardiaceae bacterium]|nr:phosphotransferase [Pseudonocardiaceae bacterium]
MNEFRFAQGLVRALLREQHPDLADLDLRDVAGGWGNQQWRLGTELGVRMPRTEGAPALLRTEQRWLPVLAPRLPLPTPVPVRVGEPSALFEHTWTVTRGEMCAGDPATDLSAAWILLPACTASRFFDAYENADEATIARARAWAVLRAIHLISIGRNGRLGLPSGKPTWEPAGRAALERAVANLRR